MADREGGQCWKLGLATFVAVLSATSYQNCVAQIVPDSTLGTQIVTPNVMIGDTPSDAQGQELKVLRIDGGAVRGGNLFHSFQEFNIEQGQAAYFSNPVGIENIFSRVTGVNPSNIQGKLGVLGNANLFLINPNGIIFGANASLNVGGSFVASTASSIKFQDGTQFDVNNPHQLLTVSVPVGLQFGSTPGSIINRSQASPNGEKNGFGLPVGLKVQTNKTLALVGGNINLESGNITSEGGQIELGSVAGNSLVNLNLTNQGLVLGYESVQNFQDIQLTKSDLPTFVTTQTSNAADAGDININSRRLIVQDGSQISTRSFGLYNPGLGQFIPATGRGGDLNVNASQSVEVIGTSLGGRIFSTLASSTNGAGSAGDITINTPRLLVQDGARVLAESSKVFLAPSSQFILATGRAGNLTVNASSVEVIGTSTTGNKSRLSSSTVAAIGAGDLTINTQRLLIQDGAEISASTFGAGKAGNLIINSPQSVELSGAGTPSSLLAKSAFEPQSDIPGEGTGEGGNLNIATRNLFISDGATVTVSSEGQSNAGNLQVQAKSIRLDNKGKISATSSEGNGGGNIMLNLDFLLLDGNSEISTNAGGNGKGGNIDIDTDLLVGKENSDITANAFEGEGGFIQITSKGIFGLEPSEKLTENSDITAFSQNPSLNGVVEINRPNIDPTGESVVLPDQIVDISGLVASGCSSGGNLASQSELVVTGRGGLPPNPSEVTRSDTTIPDLGTKENQENQTREKMVSNNTTNYDSTTLVEASGWVIGSNGEVILEANPPAVTSQIPWLMVTSCNGL